MKFNLIIWFGIILHFTWGILFLVSKENLHTTTLDIVSNYFSSYLAVSLLMISASICSIVALKLKNKWISLLLLLPQQILLLLSAGGAVQAISIGSFADGIARSRYFIGADQIYAILLAIIQTIALVKEYSYSLPKWKQ